MRSVSVSFLSLNAWIVLLIAVLAFFVLYPIWLILLNSLYVETPEGMAFGFSIWREAFRQPGMADALINTIKVVATVQLISFPVAIAIAWVLARTDVPFARWIEFGFWASFLLPALATTTGWLLLLDPHYGLINRFLVDVGLFENSPFTLYSFWGIVFAHLVSNSISVKVMLLTPAFRNLNSTLEESSRICGANGYRAVMGIVLPLLTPVLLVTFLMSLIKGLEAFELELVLGAPIDFQVYSTKIYQVLRGSPPDYGTATVLAVAILLLMLPLVIFQQWATNRRSFVTVTGNHRQDAICLGSKRWPVFIVLAVLLSLTTVVPVIFQFAGSIMTLYGFFDLPQVWSLRHWVSAFEDRTFVGAFRNTLVLGSVTTTIGIILFAVIAYCSIHTRRSLRLSLDVLSWLPFMIPGVILGLSYLWFVLEVPVLTPLYGTMGVLVLVSLLAAVTLGVQLIRSAMLQLGADVEEAGRVVGGSWFRTFRSVLLPMISPTVAVVAIMIFAMTVRQVSTIVLLSTGSTTPLSVLQLEFLYGGALGPAAVVGTVVVIISLTAAAALVIIASRFRIGR
ncbi:MAG: iron ABC transporter permease [Aquisalimonadaceae bacterium]